MVKNPITITDERGPGSGLSRPPDPHGRDRALPSALAELDPGPLDQAQQLAASDAIALHHRLDHRVIQISSMRGSFVGVFEVVSMRSCSRLPIARERVVAPTCVSAVIAAVLLR